MIVTLRDGIEVDLGTPKVIAKSTDRRYYVRLGDRKIGTVESCKRRHCSRVWAGILPNGRVVGKAFESRALALDVLVSCFLAETQALARVGLSPSWAEKG